MKQQKPFAVIVLPEEIPEHRITFKAITEDLIQPFGDGRKLWCFYPEDGEVIHYSVGTNEKQRYVFQPAETDVAYPEDQEQFFQNSMQTLRGELGKLDPLYNELATPTPSM